MLFKETIYVLGDSHCSVFEYLNQDKFSRAKFEVKLVPGATALGLANPNSLTNALNEFRLFLKTIDTRKKIIFLLGEVDTGFLIWYKSEKYSVPIQGVVDISLRNYVSFLQECLSLGFRKIYVLSVPLPTIEDGQEWGEMANKRKEVRANKKERTALTLNYNNKLKKKLNFLGIPFISMDEFLYESETEVIKQKFLNKDPLDHHLDNEHYSAIIKDALYKNRVIGRTIISFK